MAETVLEIEGLKTQFHTDSGVVHAVDGVTLSIAAGHTLGVVGESGSGKSVTSLSVMRLLPDRSAQIAAGRVSFLGQNLLDLSAREMGQVRGRQISMVFQEPMTALNPVYRVGRQVAEAIVHHHRVSWRKARARAEGLFEEVGIADAPARLDRYPHQLSGGQLQRVMIAMALACDPVLLIADEPTTALDVTIQAQILALLRRLRDTRNMAMLFVTHDLGVIAEIADEVAVMYRGRLVEHGSVEDVFAAPQHPYTKGLLACRPRLDTPYRLLPTVSDFLESWEEEGELHMRERTLTPERERALREGGREKMPEGIGDPLLSVRDLCVKYPVRRDLLGRTTDWFFAVDGISFDIYPGQTLGLVGESGCGKTTTARAILRLVEASGGSMHYRARVHDDESGSLRDHRVMDLVTADPTRIQRLRQDIQIVFQDPSGSLNPRLTVEQALLEPMEVFGIGDTDEDRRDRAVALLREVGLEPEHLRRYPHEFSGGQKQRVCIARSLVVEPQFVVCDETVSALDVSVQAQVLNLLKELQLTRGLTYLFISHDLSVVKFMSDVICVMRDGKIVESGPSEAVYASPQEAYTRNLIAAIPRDDLEHIRRRQQQRRDARG